MLPQGEETGTSARAFVLAALSISSSALNFNTFIQVAFEGPFIMVDKSYATSSSNLSLVFLASGVSALLEPVILSP